MHFNSQALIIFTDGSSYQHPRIGGFGMVFVFPEELNKEPILICPPGYYKATNNQMELKACSAALLEASKMDRCWQSIIINTDSQYVCGNYKNAMYSWSKNKWMRRNGAPVLNADLWKELIKNIQKVGVFVEICWVKGHAKSEYNKMADKLAKESAKRANKAPLAPASIRRKKSNKKTELGSVKMLGQKITIRIIETKSLKKGLSRHRYEVISKKSLYCGNVDFIYSEKLLRAGHEFYVLLNNDQNYPRVEKVYRDITREKQTKTEPI